MTKRKNGLKMKEQIAVGDLVKMRTENILHPSGVKDREITGIVVGTTQEDQKDLQAEDYWVRVVFLDGSKSTLFHDEVDVLVKNENR
jgi:hypothetical protein